jgi:hypothetical protein
MPQWLLAAALGATAVVVAMTLRGAPAPRRTGRRPSAQFGMRALRTVPGWQVIEGRPDVDLVVIAPSVVLAVTLRPCLADDRSGLAADLAAATRAASTVRNLLDTDAALRSTPVAPVLAIDGLNAPVPAEALRRHRDVYVVDGVQPGRWMRGFASPDLTTEQRDAVAACLGGGIAVGRAAPVRRRPAPAMRDGAPVTP